MEEGDDSADKKKEKYIFDVDPETGICCVHDINPPLTYPGITIFDNIIITLPHLGDLKSLERSIKPGLTNELLLDKSMFTIQNNWNTTIKEIYDKRVKRQLKWCDVTIDINNPRLLILTEGSSYHHKATKETKNNTGYWMIGLPSIYKGGNLRCYLNQIDNQPPTICNEFDYFAFLSGMNVDIEEIKSGTRIYLIYTIYSCTEVIPSAEKFSNTIQKVEETLLLITDNLYPLTSLDLWPSRRYENQLNFSRSEFSLISTILEANKKLIGTPHEIEMWMFGMTANEPITQYFLENSILKWDAKCLRTHNDMLTYFFLHKVTMAGSTIALIKKSHALDELCGISNQECFYSYICSSKNVSLKEKIAFSKNQTSCSEDMKFFLYRLLYDTKLFLQTIHEISPSIKIMKRFFSIFCKNKKSDDEKLNFIDYDENLLQITRFGEFNLLVDIFDDKWDRYNEYINNKQKNVIQLPNGVLIKCKLNHKDSQYAQSIFCDVKGIYFHPDINLLVKSFNDSLKETYRDKFTLSDFISILDPAYISYFDIEEFILMINDFSTDSIKNASRITELICEERWNSLSIGILRIYDNVDIRNTKDSIELNLLTMTLMLYSKIDEFSKSIAPLFLSSLIKKYTHLTAERYIKPMKPRHIFDFFNLFCLSDSYDLAELAKPLKILKTICCIDLDSIDNYGIDEVELWEHKKYFLKARLDELVEKASQYNSTLAPIEPTLMGKMTLTNPEIWIHKNIDYRYYSVKFLPDDVIEILPSKDFHAVLQKQKYELQIDELKQKFPFLFLAKRVNPPKKEDEEEPNNKAMKTNSASAPSEPKTAPSQ